jgi:hypothetical protein
MPGLELWSRLGGNGTTEGTKLGWGFRSASGTGAYISHRK